MDFGTVNLRLGLLHEAVLSRPFSGLLAVCLVAQLAGCLGGGVASAQPALAQSELGLDCDLPPATDAEVIIYLAASGSGIPSVSLTGPDDATTLTMIEVEQGVRPLYLLIVSEWPLISVVTGATERLARVVATSTRADARGAPAAGVVGVPSERVVLLAPPSCLSRFFEPGEESIVQARNEVASELGRHARLVRPSLSTARMLIPSGRAVEAQERDAPAGFDPESWEGALRFYPAGLGELDPDLVVSESEPVSYDVLPGHFGLAQLVSSGAMQRVDRTTFRLVRPVARYPADLLGSQLVLILLAPGVPEPAGDPGDACVVSEVTGEPVRPAPECDLAWLNPVRP